MFEDSKLYEKLSVLRFVEEHFREVQPTIEVALEQKLNHFFFDQKNFKQKLNP
jgi:hypothetical protein